MKSNDDKKVNRIARELNKWLAHDVFGDRFVVHQLRKTRGNKYELPHYLYELRDEVQPERNRYVGWVNAYDASRVLCLEMNQFIVESNFWELYNSKKG